MSNSPKRITVALDEKTTQLLEELKKEFDENQSQVIREALTFYYDKHELIEDDGEEKLNFYTKMLSSGEHIILDVDHWTLFFKYLDKLPKDSEFWKELPRVAKSHADQLKENINSPKDYLKRIEACNFFNMQETSYNEFTLLLNSKESKEFIKQLIKNTLTEMGYNVKITEDISKLRVKVTN